jgi:integrase
MPKRNHHLHGSIFKRATSNMLYIKFKGQTRSTDLIDTPENRKLAEEALRDLNARERLHGMPSATEPTIAMRFLEFLAAKGSEFQPKTLQGYKTAYRIIFLPFEGKRCRIHELRNALHTFVNTTTLSPVSVNIYLRSVGSFIHWLERRQAIASFTDFPDFYRKTTKKLVLAWTDDELKIIYAYFKKHDYELYLLLRFLELTGLRITEALSITWDTVQDKRIISKDKTRTDTLTLSDQAVKLLKELKKKYPQNHEYLFRWKPQSKSRINRTFNDGLQACGIDKKGRAFHTFRKTFATRLFEHDLSVVDIKDLMRHKNIQTTLSHYKEHRSDRLAKVLNEVEFSEM